MAAARVALPRLPAAAGLVFLALAQVARPASGDGLAIVGATVIDGTGAPALAEAVVVVQGQKIRSVGPRSLVALPKGIPYLDGRGLFVVPGRVREPAVAAALRDKVRGGAPFELALEDALRAGAPVPPVATIEADRTADLVVLAKDPRLDLENLGSVKRIFVEGREIGP